MCNTSMYFWKSNMMVCDKIHGNSEGIVPFMCLLQGFMWLSVHLSIYNKCLPKNVYKYLSTEQMVSSCCLPGAGTFLLFFSLF